MHLLAIPSTSLDETETAVDLGQTPADIMALSFSDSDLSALAAALAGEPGMSSEPQAGEPQEPPPSHVGGSLRQCRFRGAPYDCALPRRPRLLALRV